MKQNKQQSGQSLMEAIVAMAILLMVVIAILGLTVSSIAGQRESEQQVIANNLAREGIELVRNIRDSNWLAGIPVGTGISEGAEGIIDYDSLEIDYTPLQSSILRLDKSSKFYDHDSIDFIISPYSRVIRTQAICLPKLGGEEEIKDLFVPCDSGQQGIGGKITAIVSWNDGQRDKSVSIESLLYDWK